MIAIEINMNAMKLSVRNAGPQDASLAKKIAEKLFCSLNSSDAEVELWVSETDGLSLACPLLDPKARLQISLHSGAANHRRRFGGGKSQMIAKAVGIEPGVRPTVVDATAGLGGDAFVLACLGASVTMLEKSRVLVAMLYDALERARIFSKNSETNDLAQVIDRMTLIHVDACEWLENQDDGFSDVIYLDPMFPDRQKSSAIKKEMKIMQQLVGGEDQRENVLLEMALQKASHRVVAKRPRHAEPLPGPEPQYALQGKSTRFDVYPLKSFRKDR